MGSLRSGYRIFCKLEEWLVGGIIVGVTALVFFAALARTAGHPINWATDLALLFFAWLVFLGADVSLRHADFMRVDLLLRQFPMRIQKALYYIFYVMAILFLMVIVVQGVPLAIENSKRLFQTLGISYAWATVSAPVGSFLMIITIALKLVRNWNEDEIVVDAKEAI